MKFLDKEKLSENTLLLFLTDNGSIHPIRKKGTDIDSVSGRRGMKGKLYEGGHRVPLFIRGPEHLIGKPRELSIFSAHIDLLPTFVDFVRTWETQAVKLANRWPELGSRFTRLR